MKTNNKVNDSKESKDKFTKGNGKPSSRRGRKERSERKPLDNAGRDNDPNHYFSSKELADEVCRLSFNSFLGEGNVAGTTYSVPSVVRVGVNPSPFNSYDIQDINVWTQIKRSGLNLAITKLYTSLASFSGRAANYAPQDVGAVVLAMGEIISCVEDLRRVVGVSYTFSERNRALPKILISALGYDYNDFIRNRAIYVDRLNALITRFNALPILGNVSYILKCRDMYQKVYTDSPSAEATIIVMVPNSTWELDESSYSGGTILKTKQWTPYSGTTTFKDHLDMLDDMVEALFGSTTLNTIYADLLNLASKAKVDMFKMDYVTSDYIVLPEYNANFLLQLHNADFTGYPIGATYGNIYGDMKGTPLNDVYPDPANNGLIYNPIFNYHLANNTQTAHYMSLVDLPDANPSVENIIEATRYKCISGITVTIGDDVRSIYATIPDHYFVYMWVFSNSDTYDAAKSFADNWPSTNNVSHANMLSIASAMSQIDWHPILYRQYFSPGNAVSQIIGDLNFYTQISPTTLAAMNRIIAQELFDFRIG